MANTIDTGLLDQIFDEILTDDISGFAGDNEAFQVPGEVITYVAGEPILNQEDIYIGGVKRTFVTQVQFIDPILSSMAIRHTDARTFDGIRIDFNATVVSNRKLSIQLPDGNWIDLLDFAIRMVRKGNPNLSLNNTEIALKLKNYGFDPSGRLPMYLQHLGANEDLFMRNSVHFQSLGALSNVDQVRNSSLGTKSVVAHSFRHPEGIRMSSLDVSKVDRTQSTTDTSTGYIGFFDAAFNTLTYIIGMDKRRSVLKKIGMEQGEEAFMSARQEEAKMRDLFQTARLARAFRNWGGTARVVRQNVLEDDVVDSIEYFPQQVPCGRFAVDSGYGPGDTMTYSVWRARTFTNRIGEPMGEGEETPSEAPEASEPVTNPEATF